MRGLGMLHAYGLGVTKDYAQARNWYEKAAALGDLPAMVFLGGLYEDGHGVSIDRDQACQWCQKAINGGYEPAKEKRRNLR
jgi:uncharacterized protein